MTRSQLAKTVGVLALVIVMVVVVRGLLVTGDDAEDAVPATIAPSTTSVPPAPTCTGVPLPAGADIQAALDANGADTRFCLAAGEFRVPAPLVPKAGQELVATRPRESILTGGGVTPVAWDGLDVPNARLEGLVIERFPTPAGGGLAAVRLGDNGVMVDNEVRLNAHTAVYHGNHVELRGNSIHDNWSGIRSFRTVGAVIEDNEVYNHNQFNPRLDGSGSKWTGTRDLVVRNNHFHDNFGPGIWVDGDNINVLIEGNRSNDNVGLGGKGIQYEVSCAGVVRDNLLEGNETSGIELVASQNVEVYGNRLRGNGNGIRVWHQARERGTNCEWTLANVVVRDNTVRMDKGSTGLWKHNVDDGDAVFDPEDGRVRFEDNDYYLSGMRKYFQWGNGLRSRGGWQHYGQDLDGTFVIEPRCEVGDC